MWVGRVKPNGMTRIPEHADVDYGDGEGERPTDYPTLSDKAAKAFDVAHRALEAYDDPAVVWTGGADSTLTLHVVRAVADRRGHDRPPAVFPDHFQHFPDVVEFVERWADEWGIDLHVARNEDVAANATEPGGEVRVEDLNEANRHHVREVLKYDGETFPFLLDGYVGNHLLKTVPLNDAIETRGVDGVVSAVRWDERGARADETFFSPRRSADAHPAHDRVRPILPFTEADVWAAMWTEVVPATVPEFPDEGHVPDGAGDLPDGVGVEDVPVSGRYFEGYRSLGSAVSAEREDDSPAWVQERAATSGRTGGTRDDEDLMDRLRDLGYV